MPGVLPWKVMVSKIPEPFGPGGEDSRELQTTETVPVPSIGPMQMVERPVLPRKAPCVPDTKVRTAGLNARVIWKAPRLETLSIMISTDGVVVTLAA